MPGRLHEFGETLREIGGTIDPRNPRTQLTGAGVGAVLVLIAALFALPGSSHTKSNVAAGDNAASQGGTTTGSQGSAAAGSRAGGSGATKGAGGAVGKANSAASSTTHGW